jgi:hypothetical protein
MRVKSKNGLSFYLIYWRPDGVSQEEHETVRDRKQDKDKKIKMNIVLGIVVVIGLEC